MNELLGKNWRLLGNKIKKYVGKIEGNITVVFSMLSFVFIKITGNYSLSLQPSYLIIPVGSRLLMLEPGMYRHRDMYLCMAIHLLVDVDCDVTRYILQILESYMLE